MSDLISRGDAIKAVLVSNLSACTVFGRSEEGMATARELIQVIKKLPSVQSEQRWIPVTERLPKQGQEVICQCRANIIKVLKLDADGDWYQDAEHCYMYGFVIAWMPLPEPWKEGEADGNQH